MTTMNHKIRAVDLKPGMFVIVQEWLDEIGHESELVDRWGRKPKKPIGDPFRILAIALPLVTVEILETGQRGVLDSREISFAVVDKKYVKSLIPDFRKQRRELTDYEKKLRDGRIVERYTLGKGWESIITEKK